jgi:hypothetical protein
MRFRPDGPDIPDDLIALQEKGETIFICGAGISRMIGLPSFRGLVERVYAELGEDWQMHPAEREVMRDDANGDVPSVAAHPQNAHHFGFYPIVRVLTDLWERIASRERATARMLVSGWLNSPYPIVRRIYVFAVCSEGIFNAEEGRL